MGNLDALIRASATWIKEQRKSSGFFPFAAVFIPLLIVAAAVTVWAPGTPLAAVLAYCVGGGFAFFLALFAWKAHVDPGFCRSETHIEALKRIAARSQQKGDEPKLIKDEPDALIANPAVVADAPFDAQAIDHKEARND